MLDRMWRRPRRDIAATAPVGSFWYLEMPTIIAYVLASGEMATLSGPGTPSLRAA